MTDKRTVLFHRQYDRYSGGQQKVLDYFGHCLHHPNLEPYISWGKNSVAIESTPWSEYRSRAFYEFHPDEYHFLFLAGMDWQDYLQVKKQDQPVINLIQHVRHADPDANVHPFLKEAATRICVSQQVKAAIDETGIVNGPTIAIPNGIDTDLLDEFSIDKEPDSIYILGLKQPELAVQLEAAIGDQFKVICHTEHVVREEVLKSMAESEISVLLPHATEGFYLPALEAMGLSKLVVVPDCVGNRSFCMDGINCLMPGMDLKALVSAIMKGRQLLSHAESAAIQENARKTLSDHSLQRERQAFYTLIASLPG